MDESHGGAPIPGHSDFEFLSGGGALGALMRERDWSTSPLGPPAGWSPALKTTVSTLLPAAMQIVLFWGPDFIALYNDAYAPTIGDKHPRALGRPARENWAELWDDLEPLLRQVHDRGETVHAEDRPFYIERYGHPETAYFDISYSPVRDAAGGIAGVLCLVRETTQKIVGRRKVQETEARFHALADSIDQMIWSTLPDGYHDYYNQRWYEFTGMPEGSTDGEAWNGMFHPDDQARAWAVWSRCLETGEPYHIEYRLRHRSGQYRWVIGRAQPVRDESGAIIRWYGTCTDHHDLKEAQQRVARSEERLQFALAAGGGIGTWDWDIVNDRVYADRAFATLYGVDPERAASGAPLAEFTASVHPDDRDFASDAIDEAMRNGSPFLAEYRLIQPDGSVRWVEARGQSHLDAAGNPVRFPGVVMDITDRKAADAALQESVERYRLARQATNDAIWDWDLLHDHVMWNEALETVYGHRLDTVGGNGAWWIEHIHPDDRARIERSIHDVIDHDGTHWTDEYRFRRADGSYAFILDRGAVVRDGEGKAVRMIGAMLDLTSARAADAAVRASEDRLRLATAATQIGIWDFDLAHDRLEWDERVRAGFGISADTPVDYDLFLRGIHPDDRDATDIAVKNALEPGGPGTYDIEYRTIGLEDGQERWIAARGRTQFEDGKAVRFIGTTLDISARKQVEADLASTNAALRESEKQYRTLFETIDEGFCVIEFLDGPHGPLSDYVHVSANPAYEKNAGIPNVVGQKVREMVPAEAEEWVRLYREVLVTGRPIRFERELEATGRYLELAAFRVEPAERRQVAVLFQDITARAQSENALREERGRLETLNRTGTALASQLSLGKVVQIATDAGVELSGAQFGAFFYNVTDDKGESYMLYALSGATPEQFDFGMPRNTAVFHTTFSGEGVVRSDDITQDPRYGKMAPHFGMPAGHLPVRSYLAAPVISSSGEVIGGLFFGHADPGCFEERHEALIVGISAQAAIAMDNARLYQSAQSELASRMRAEQELRLLNETLEQRVDDEIGRRAEAEEALRQAQKMETLGQLTGGVAHDFNNLLQIVSGNIGLIQRGLPEDNAKLRRAAENAARGAERAAILTQRLLAFSRRQPLAPKPIDPNKLVGGMSELLHRTLGETIEVETVLSSGLWPVEVDPHQLENALLNLAINARDAMSDGGKLTIETCNTHLDRAYTAQNAEVAPGQYVCLAVSDTGTGMDEDTVARAFEPFFTTKEVGKGTGLGLSMVYGFVKQSGGHLKIYSEVGHGSTVKIYLPRLVGEREAQEEDQQTLIPEGAQNETILVCEDDDDVRAFTVEVLRELGYRVLEAPDGPTALGLLERHARAIDLLFTDVVLPAGMTGAVLAQRAREMRPDLKVLFTTGYARNAIVHHGRLDPGVELITKPFSYADLAARVRDMLDGTP